MEHVGAHHARGGEPEQQDQADRDQRAGPGRGHAEHEAHAHAQHDGGDLVPPLELDRVALALVHALEERANERGRAGEEQRAGEDREQQVVEVARRAASSSRSSTQTPPTAAGTEPSAIQLDSRTSTVLWRQCL